MHPDNVERSDSATAAAAAEAASPADDAPPPSYEFAVVLPDSVDGEADRGDDDWSPWQRQNQQRRQESLEAEFWSAVAEAQLEEEEEVVTRPQLQPRSYAPLPPFTTDPSQLSGERLRCRLPVTPAGFGFSVVSSSGGGWSRERGEQFIQVRRVVRMGAADEEGTIREGDVLVHVNEHCVLGMSDEALVSLLQSYTTGEEIELDVCRGYAIPLPAEGSHQVPPYLTTPAVVTSEPPRSVPEPTAAQYNQVHVSAFTTHPVSTNCPHCRAYVATDVKRTPSCSAVICCCFIALVGCFCGCCLFPLFADGCSKFSHRCPNCKKNLHTYEGKCFKF